MAFVKPQLYQKSPGVFGFQLECPKCGTVLDVNYIDRIVTCVDCGEGIYLLAGDEIA